MEKSKAKKRAIIASVFFLITVSAMVLNNSLSQIRTVDILQILAAGMLLGVLLQTLFQYASYSTEVIGSKGKR